MNFLNKVAILLLALHSVPSFASDKLGYVSSLYARSGDQLEIVEIEGALEGPRPDCAARTTYYAVTDERSSSGQAQYAMLLAAQISNRKIKVMGTGACTRWPDAEDILLVMLQN